MHYIATWFYKEGAGDASFYPQAGGRGDSALLHSIYMQIQVPFFITFAHYNPDARLLFFTNMEPAGLPPYLQRLFQKLSIEVVTLPYRHQPPKGWHKAWRNQFYLYDIFAYMQTHMAGSDTLLVCDADCICSRPLQPLWQEMDRQGRGAALYEMGYSMTADINGTTCEQMTQLYADCYGTPPQRPITYCGGEFIVLRGDVVARLNEEYDRLWQFNLKRFAEGKPKLNEEALFFSVMAERLGIRNRIANSYVKRMWTLPEYCNVEKGDEQLAVWHMPYEKKRGLYRLYRLLSSHPSALADNEAGFWERAGRYCGIPRISTGKRIYDRIQTLARKIANK